ncbi:hypothetical protein C8A03DRAFT_29250 [Achaetomium macrosporum]|uniref:Rhomboid family membrane protein n=1 Tax=Achaetomium macrosporum TaxID=79813 RepID=A0AAN7HAC5_9PEZI|nr:hypothetical protein C8A03DRAFT_29250 [Achaetomium macrosporum]
MSSENPQQPQAPPPTSSQPEETPLPERNPITHNAAIAAAILCPIALLLPTRGGAGKSMLQNSVLGGASFWGFNQLAHDYTGKSITARSSERWGALLGRSPQEQHQQQENKKGVVRVAGLPTERAARNRELMEAERRRRAEAEGREYKGKDTRGFWERMWMGGEKEGWKEKRLEEERKAIESGKGYGGLIMDQISEVWGGKGKGDGEEGKKKGEGEGEGKQ